METVDRRNFLALSTQAAVAASLGGMSAHAASASSKPSGKMPEPIMLPPQVEGDNEKMPAFIPKEQRIGYAVIGLGRLSLDQILPALKESKRSKLTALVSGDRKKAEAVAKMYDVPETSIYDYKNFDSIKNNPDVHAVFIVLPNSMHKEYTIRAAKAGKHVLCEKPMAMNPEECQEMIDACKAADVKLMVAYRVQYNPMHLKVKKEIENGRIGDVIAMDLQNLQNQSAKNVDQWRHKIKLAGGGPLPNVGVYCFNTARFLIGEEPTEIMATLHQPKDDARFKETEETVSWSMKFPSGVIAQCLTSHGAMEGKRYSVLGTKGAYVSDPAFPYEGVKVKFNSKDGNQELDMPEENQFAVEMDHFSMCITDNKKPFTPGEEGLQDHKIQSAIYESARTGKLVKLENFKGKDVFRGQKPEGY
jgi:predicted dehydrogenase